MDTHDDVARLWALIKDIRFAMLTTKSRSGHLHSRPVTTQNKSLDGGRLWFFIAAHGDPAAEIGDEHEVNLAYADPGDDKYVSVSGTAALVRDIEKKRELWNPMAKAWFPGGPEDPEVQLLEVTIEHAEYWDVKDSKLTQMFKMAKAAVTGSTPKDMAKTGQVRMH